jgi:hypothetical protein
MKNSHNPVCNFYISKNKARFWVRDTMHIWRQNIGQQGEGRSYIYSAVISKPTQNTLQQ